MGARALVLEQKENRRQQRGSALALQVEQKENRAARISARSASGTKRKQIAADGPRLGRSSNVQVSK